MFWKAVVITTFIIGSLAAEQPTEFCDTILGEPFNAASNCAKGIFILNTTDIGVESKKEDATLAEVNEEYCTKAQQLRACIDNLVSALESCSYHAKATKLQVIYLMYGHTIDFTCRVNGSALTLYIADKAPECVAAKEDIYQNCFARTPLKTMESEFQKTLSDKDRAEERAKLTECAVKALDGCRYPAASSELTSMLRELYELMGPGYR